LQDIAIEAAKGVLLLAILETLVLSRPASWLEVRALRAPSRVRSGVGCDADAACSFSVWQEHVDYLSLQALLFERNTGLNLYQQTRLLYAFQRRVTD
jgi:hypothetical protein